MSRVRNAPGYEAKNPKLRLLRWPTRGEQPASVVGFHRPADPRGRVVQAAMVVEFNPRGKGRSPSEVHTLAFVGSTPTPATTEP